MFCNSKVKIGYNFLRNIAGLSCLFLLLCLGLVNELKAQDINQRSQQFRLGEGMIRIAEPGQLADSINVWGDVPNTGRFLIPKGTSLPELISYAGGPQNLNTGQLNISKVKITVNISRYMGVKKGRSVVSSFEFEYKEPIPPQLYGFNIKNNDVVAIEVRRKSNFLDYIKVIGPIVTTFTSILILSNRL